MADVKNFGLVGVGSNVQFGKAGSKIVLDNGTFTFRNAAASADVAITAGDVTSSGAVTAATGVTATTGGVTAAAGNLTATLGNLALSAAGATIGIHGDTTLSRYAAGVFKFDGTGAVALPIGSTQPAGTAGMIRANNSGAATIIEYYDGSAWQTIATGGNTGTLSTELQDLRDSLGSMVNNTTGIWNDTALDAMYGTNPADLTTALNNLAGNITAKDTLDEIFPSTQAGNVIYSNGSNNWVQAAPGQTSGVQAWDAGLAALASKTSTGIMAQTGNDTYTAVTVSATGGLTVTDTTGTDGGLALGTTGNLAALNSMAGSGIAVRNGDGTWANKTISSDNADLTVTNGDGTAAGNIKLNLAGNLNAVAGLTTTGYIVRTGNGTATTRSMNVVSGDLVITGDAAGVSTDTTFGLATVTQAATGDFVKVTLDTKGRVTGNTAVTTADITALVDGTYVNVAGDTMTGDLSFGGTYKVTGLAAPVDGGDATNKAYVDNAVAGLTWKQAVNVLAASDIALSGSGTLTIDGDDVQDGYRLLLIGQATATENGIYVATVNGGNYTLARSADANTYQELIGATVFVMEGTQYASTGWTQSNHYLTSFAGQVWVQFSGGGTYSGSGAITVTGTTIALTSGNGLSQTGGTLAVVPTSANAVQLQGTDGSKTVGLVLDTGSGLEQSATGLKISAAGVTNAMLAHSYFTLNADTGTTPVDLGDTYGIIGDSAQGVSTAVLTTGIGSNEAAVKVTVANASSSQKGVATFNAASFDVSVDGDVTVKAGGINNTQLAASAIFFTGNSGPDNQAEVNLGTNLEINGDGTITTSVNSSTNVISVNLGTVPVSKGGTGATSFTANQLIYGNGTSALAQSSALSFDPAVGAQSQPTLTLGQTTISGGTSTYPDFTITAATGGDISLVPASGQSVIIAGAVGDSTIQSDAGTGLTVRGNTTLTLESGSGSTTMLLPTGTSNKVSVSGPTAADYATGLAANDLTNKQYVDTAIASGAAAGAIKAFTASVSGSGTTNIGSAMPAGATVLSVKLQVTTADSAATVSVGKSGSVGAYMSVDDNDPSATGLYMAETYVTESAATTATITVSGATSFVGKVIVQYQVAQ